MGQGAAPAELVVAVTGGTGFIGSRLIEMFGNSELPFRLRVLSRRRTGAGPGSACAVDLANPASVKAALAGCTALIHCAFDFADMEANLEIARVLARECAAIDARLVHVSTAAVYEPFPDGTLDESFNVDRPASAYQGVKLAIERELLEQVHQAGLDVVILQPTVVYGPHGRAWTDSPVRELLTGTVVLPDFGEGLCNAVYIDDVCRAIVAATLDTVPSGERILVSGPRAVAWREFYGAYAEMLGLNAVELAPPESIAPSVQSDMSSGAAPSLAAKLKRAATKLLGARIMWQANLVANYARGLVLRRHHLAKGPKLSLFRSRCHIQIDKARRLLAYEPEFDLERGMEFTRAYVDAQYGRLARLKARR